jgi:hypothetical protein
VVLFGADAGDEGQEGGEEEEAHLRVLISCDRCCLFFVICQSVVVRLGYCGEAGQRGGRKSMSVFTGLLVLNGSSQTDNKPVTFFLSSPPLSLSVAHVAVDVGYVGGLHVKFVLNRVLNRLCEACDPFLGAITLL